MNEELWIDPVGCKVYFNKPDLSPDISFEVIRKQKVNGTLEEHKDCRHEYCNLSKETLPCWKVIQNDLRCR